MTNKTKPKVSEQLKQIITDIAYSAGDCYEDFDNPYVTKYLPKLQSLLDQQKQELVEMVEGMKSDEPSDNGLMYPVEALHKSYNQALNDIKEALNDTK